MKASVEFGGELCTLKRMEARRFSLLNGLRAGLLAVGLFGAHLVATAAENAPAAAEGGYDKVGFDLLASYEYVAPDYDPSVPNAKPPSGADQIPAPVKALDKRKVAVTGFMLPTKMEGGLVKEFLLVKDAMMCCYGAMPKVNEWVVVKMTGKGVKPLLDIPITFEGKLSVGEMYENGYLTGLYLLDGEKMGEVKG